MTEQEWLADRIAQELAHARVNGQVYMNGLHNPKPSEILRGKRLAAEFMAWREESDGTPEG